MMCPLELEILLHYRYCTNEYRNGDFSHDMVIKHIDYHCDVTELLERTGEQVKRVDYPMLQKTAYKLTKKGIVFIDHILNHDLPIQIWVIPYS